MNAVWYAVAQLWTYYLGTFSVNNVIDKKHCSIKLHDMNILHILLSIWGYQWEEGSKSIGNYSASHLNYYFLSFIVIELRPNEEQPSTFVSCLASLASQSEDGASSSSHSSANSQDIQQSKKFVTVIDLNQNFHRYLKSVLC